MEISQLQWQTIRQIAREQCLQVVGDLGNSSQRVKELEAEVASLKQELEDLQPLNQLGADLSAFDPKSAIQEGDRWFDPASGEWFIYFMGQGRSRSELEAFASAKKYL